jgi:HSP20 family protein
VRGLGKEEAMRTLALWGGANLRREMERLYDHLTEPVGEPFDFTGGDWMPKLDVTETNEAFVVTAETPGVDAKDIEVTLMGDVLTVKGAREKATEDKEERYHCLERTYGTFLRRVRLPMAVDGSKVTATFKNGELMVTLPKTPAARGTWIPVKGE